jgi:hypothetical protein
MHTHHSMCVVCALAYDRIFAYQWHNSCINTVTCIHIIMTVVCVIVTCTYTCDTELISSMMQLLVIRDRSLYSLVYILRYLSVYMSRTTLIRCPLLCDTACTACRTVSTSLVFLTLSEDVHVKQK